MQISCTGSILKTEDDIKKNGDRLQQSDSRLDGFPESYEEFRNKVLALNHSQENLKATR